MRTSYKIVGGLCFVVAFIVIFFCEKDNMLDNANDMKESIQSSKDEIDNIEKNVQTKNPNMYTDNTVQHKKEETNKKTDSLEKPLADPPVDTSGENMNNSDIVIYYEVDIPSRFKENITLVLKGKNSKQEYKESLSQNNQYKTKLACKKDEYDVKCVVESDLDNEKYDMVFDKTIDCTNEESVAIRRKVMINTKIVFADKESSWDIIVEQIKKSWFTLFVFVVLFIILIRIKKKQEMIGGEE